LPKKLDVGSVTSKNVRWKLYLIGIKILRLEKGHGIAKTRKEKQENPPPENQKIRKRKKRKKEKKKTKSYT